MIPTEAPSPGAFANQAMLIHRSDHHEKMVLVEQIRGGVHRYHGLGVHVRQHPLLRQRREWLQRESFLRALPEHLYEVVGRWH